MRSIPKEEKSGCYFVVLILVSLFMMLMPATFYVWFRFSVGNWLNRSKNISRSRFKKLTKGKKNFWWYEALNKEVKLDYCSFLIKNTVFAFGGVKKSQELKRYIEENFK